MFNTNVGTTDRAIRVVLGLALLAAWWFAAIPFGWLAAIVGLVLLGTGLMSSCPLYSLFGLSTCPINKS